jgi:SpoVK/Ycf46/Vps4 family AAA+-type ATPase
MKQNGFKVLPHANKGRKSDHTILTGYNGMLDTMLSNGIANSSVCFERLREAGYCGGLTAVKELDRLKSLPSLMAIYAHKNIAFIGPAGTGKTHLAMAFGHECCQHGLKTYFIKASEFGTNS